MTVRLSKDSRSLACDAIVDNLDAASPPATPARSMIQFFQGTRPGSVDAAPPGGNILLAQCQWTGTTAFGAAVDGVATATAISPGTILRSGEAQWYRVLDKSTIVAAHAVVNGENRQIVWDGEVTESGGGGDIEFDNTSFIEGGVIVISSLTATVPEECP